MLTWDTKIEPWAISFKPCVSCRTFVSLGFWVNGFLIPLSNCLGAGRHFRQSIH